VNGSIGKIPVLMLSAYLLFVAAMLVVFFQYPPLQDYTEWIYQSFILDELLSGKSSSYFYVRDYPVPYLASQVIMAGFSHLAGPVAAGKIYLVIYFLFAGLLSVRFVQRYQLNSVLAYPLLLSCIVCNSSFWSGFINYQIGLLVLMGYLILSDSQKSKILVNVIFSLLAFACHGFCLLAFGVIAGVRSLSRG
jgi:hypothetical protein